MYCAGSIKNFKNALLVVDFNFFAVAVLNCRIIFFHENALHKLYSQCAFSNAATTENNELILPHLKMLSLSVDRLWKARKVSARTKQTSFKICFINCLIILNNLNEAKTLKFLTIKKTGPNNFCGKSTSIV